MAYYSVIVANASFVANKFNLVFKVLTVLLAEYFFYMLQNATTTILRYQNECNIL